MLNKTIRILLLFISVFQISLSNGGFNFSVAPTKVEVNMNKDSVTEIFLVNNTDKEIKLLSYFETPPEYSERSLEGMIQVFPKLIKIEPKKDKVVKVAYKKSIQANIIKGKEYKSYIIFKELPSGVGDLQEDKITIFNEIGIAIFGRN